MENADIEKMINSRIAELEGTNYDKDADIQKLAKASKKAVKDIKTLYENETISDKEKAEKLYEKLSQEVVNSKNHEKESTINKKKLNATIRDKEALMGELSRTNTIKERLEALCRDLQKQNKAIQEEFRKVADEERRKREEISGRFESTIKDVSVKLEAQGDDRIQQMRENEELKEKLKLLVQQFELREQQLIQQLSAKQLETQLFEAKFQQKMHQDAKETLTIQAYKEQNESLVKTDLELRGQLSMYAEKFDQFQDTISKTNEVFANFKSEMEKMQGRIRTLEKENGGLRGKADQSDVAIIQMMQQNQEKGKELESVAKQRDSLKGLCKSLQDKLSLGSKPAGEGQ